MGHGGGDITGVPKVTSRTAQPSTPHIAKQRPQSGRLTAKNVRVAPFRASVSTCCEKYSYGTFHRHLSPTTAQLVAKNIRLVPNPVIASHLASGSTDCEKYSYGAFHVKPLMFD